MSHQNCSAPLKEASCFSISTWLSIKQLNSLKTCPQVFGPVSAAAVTTWLQARAALSEKTIFHFYTLSLLSAASQWAETLKVCVTCFAALKKKNQKNAGAVSTSLIDLLGFFVHSCTFTLSFKNTPLELVLWGQSISTRSSRQHCNALPHKDQQRERHERVNVRNNGNTGKG